MESAMEQGSGRSQPEACLAIWCGEDRGRASSGLTGCRLVLRSLWCQVPCAGCPGVQSPLTLDGSAPLVVAAPAHLVNAALAPETWLPEGERADIGRYRRAQDRADRFAAWGLARLLAGRLTGQPPAALAVSRSPGGRPQLTQGGADFNLSHAGGWVAVGLVRNGFIGVDLEQARSPISGMRSPRTFSRRRNWRPFALLAPKAARAARCVCGASRKRCSRPWGKAWEATPEVSR